MIHIRHSVSAAELAYHRIRLAVRCTFISAIALSGVFLWAKHSQLLVYCGESDCNFTGIPFIPEPRNSATRPAPVLRIPTTRIHTGFPELPAATADFELPQNNVPDWEDFENDDILLETDADALLTSIPQRQQKQITRTHRTPQTTSQPVRETYTPPAYLNCPQPPFPASLRNRRTESSVGCTISVTPDGTPHEVEITEPASQHSLNTHTRNWILRHWRFSPASRNGKPVAAKVHTTIHFRLQT